MAITIHKKDGNVRRVTGTHKATRQATCKGTQAGTRAGIASADATQRITKIAANCEALNTLRDALNASDEAQAKYRAEQTPDESSAPSLCAPEDAGDQQDLQR